MRVLLSCLQSLRQHRLPAYHFWRSHFVEGCREAGIECIEVPDVDWAEGLTYPAGGHELLSWRERTWERVLAFARREHARQCIDFFLGYLYPSQIEPDAIVQLQCLGIPCVNFFCDNVREFDRVPVEYLPFALHWVPEFEALPIYKSAGLPHAHVPMPCWVPNDLRTVPADELEPATFLGSADILRRDILGRALKAGATFEVRGRGWSEESEKSEPSTLKQLNRSLLANQMRLVRARGVTPVLRKVQNKLFALDPPPIPPNLVRPTVSDSDYLRITREAVIAIGVNRVPTARRSDRNPLVYSRLRDLEAPMVGACYLTEWTAGLGMLFDLGQEIETYRTAEELAGKIKELSRDPMRRRRLREQGQRRALNDHSAANSLKLISRRATGQ